MSVYQNIVCVYLHDGINMPHILNFILYGFSVVFISIILLLLMLKKKGF